MSYNGSGVFNINTAGQPVVTGTVISSTAFNALTADLATGLTTALTKDGQTTPTANIPMGGFKITGIAAATTLGDALSYGRAATVSTLTNSALTSGRVPYASTAGLLVDSSTFTYNGTTVTVPQLTDSGLTNGRVTFAGASGLLTDSANLTFGGSTLTVLNNASAQSIYLSRTSATARDWALGIDGDGAFRLTDVTGSNVIFSAGAAGITTLTAITDLVFKSNNTEKMRLDSTGNLNVGTTSTPAGSSSLSRFITAAGTNDGVLQVTRTSATAGGGAIASAAGPGMIFYTHTGTVASETYTERMRIDTSGNVGIGTSSPSTYGKLAVYGGNVWISGAGSDTSIQITDANNANVGLILKYLTSPGDAEVNSKYGNLIFKAANTERGRFNTTGALVLAGGTLAANGIGITFPSSQSASSNANTLDDYEEGTWTPTDGSGAGLSFTGVSAAYTKIGRQVFVNGTVTYPTTASTADAQISGLPFVYGSGTDYTQQGSPIRNNKSLSIQPFGLNSGVSSFVILIIGQYTTYATNVQLTGGTIMFSFNYYTT